MEQTIKKNMKTRVLEYMIEFGSITTLQAFVDLGCTRLSEYIRQIRCERVVKDEWIKSKNRYGEKVEFKKYWLDK